MLSAFLIYSFVPERAYFVLKTKAECITLPAKKIAISKAAAILRAIVEIAPPILSGIQLLIPNSA